ncbi:choice-of-anchor A family protein [Phenylobacterium sp. SCN 70-31]|uniref:choice-of-anchor A family protein n=1 Tax=Phenylobacterium sp. SCN 70-31 TaxID=1660129 RepID=UPI0008694F49|nr:choice-of-anchor A family protein [Phenylobacterium sp. SCN 70-31]ODT84754.1 MAG: hypothetical protein ABS78_22160 [Phenylobacterium sp. SCN 70-31]
MRAFTAILAAAALTAVATPTLADTAQDFQFYTLGNLNLNGQTLNGRVAAGGNAQFSSSSLMGAGSSLVVGGDLTYLNGGTVANGALVGGSSTAPGYLPISAGQSTLPVDFTTENLRLKNLSTTLAGLETTGTAYVQWGGLFFDGLTSGLNIVTIDASQLAGVNWLGTNLATGTELLINVTGNTASLGGGLHSNAASTILWNFANATAITAGGVSLGGSILAPNAAFQGNSGTISGSLITGSFNGAISFGNSGYTGGLLAPSIAPALPGGGLGSVAVPEPSVWAMMILGFGAVGAVLRRRRAPDALAA